MHMKSVSVPPRFIRTTWRHIAKCPRDRIYYYSKLREVHLNTDPYWEIRTRFRRIYIHRPSGWMVGWIDGGESDGVELLLL